MRQRLAAPIVLRRVSLERPVASREVDMILDSGAMYTAVSWDVAKDLGYDPAGSSDRVPVIIANGIIEVPKIVLNRMAFRHVSAEQIEVICHDIPELAEIEGLVGLSFLKHFRVLMDFKGGADDGREREENGS